MLLMQVCNKFIDQQLSRLRQVLSIGLFEKVEKIFVAAADIATPVAAAIGSLIALVLAVKTDSFQIFLASFAWIFSLIVLYYVGGKLQNACKKTLDNNPSSIGNQEYLDVVTVLGLVTAAGALLVGLYLGLKLSSFQTFVVALGASVFLVYSAWLTLQPSLLTTYVEESSSAGLDAIAILVLANKIYLRSNKIIFGLLTVIGTALLAQALFNSFGEPFEILRGGVQGLMGFILVILGLTAPLICYLLFVFSYMLLDVLRSILGMGKPSLPMKTMPATPAEEPLPEINISADTLKKIGLIVVILVVGLTVAIKGKELFNEYQAKAEISRIEEEQKKAEEEALKAAEAAEAARIEAFAQNVRPYVNKPALDLVLNKEINGLFREIFGNNTSVFEAYFEESNTVTETDGLLLASGCRKEECSEYKALAIIDLKATKVAAIVIMGAEVRMFEIEEANAPAAVKKWLMANRP